MANKILIGSDHGGYKLKNEIIKHLNSMNIEVEDSGFCKSLKMCV